MAHFEKGQLPKELGKGIELRAPLEGNAKKNPPKHPMNKRERQWLVAWHSKGHQRVRGSIDSTGQIKDIVLFTSHPPSSLASRRSRRGPVGLEVMEQVLRIAHVLLCSCQQQSHGTTAQAAAGSEDLMHVLIYIRQECLIYKNEVLPICETDQISCGVFLI